MPSYYRDPAAPEPNAPRRIGVTALIERDGAFLVERRVDDAHEWAFIGGTLEEDEQLLEALRREVREETGFDIERAELLGVFSDPSRIRRRVRRRSTILAFVRERRLFVRRLTVAAAGELWIEFRHTPSCRGFDGLSEIVHH